MKDKGENICFDPLCEIHNKPQRSENVCPTCGAFGLAVKGVASSEPQHMAFKGGDPKNPANWYPVYGKIHYPKTSNEPPQEWTPEQILKYLNGGGGAMQLAKDINAALAAADADCEKALQFQEARYGKLFAELAAEQEKRNEAEVERNLARVSRESLYRELTAERNYSEYCTELANERLKETVTLKQELAAERERNKTLVEFLNRCADHMISGSNIADTPLPTEQEWRDILALAKAKEGE